MSSTLMAIIIIAALVLIIGSIAGYFIARRMRGAIRLTLMRRGFNPGEQVEGSFVMETRKPIEGKRLFVALVGKEVTRERYRDSNNREQTRSHTREIYRREQTLEDVKNYAAGQVSEYKFQLSTPSEHDEGFFDSNLGQALKMGMELIGGRRTYLEWRVSARLDAEGIDLGDSESITINF